jgi:predicted small secreted protein
VHATALVTILEGLMKKMSTSFSRAVHIAFAMAVLAGGLVTLGACNTTAGVGEDVSATGHAVTDTAEKAKQGL